MKKKFEVSPNTVRHRTKNVRVPADPAWTAALIERYREGPPLRMLGAEFGCSHQTVCNMVERWESWYDRTRAQHVAA